MSNGKMGYSPACDKNSPRVRRAGRVFAMSMSGGIVAVVVTYRREAELARLLTDLEQSRVPLLACVVVDHEGAGKARALSSGRTLDIRVHEDATNPGPGAGWANGARLALAEFDGRVEGILYLDDDVTLPPGTLGILLEEKAAAGALAIAPLLEDAGGRLWAFPEPAPAAMRRLIREAATPADALRLLGAAPIPFRWATGACFLVDRSGVEQVGFHRPDFWMLGDDLEYSMRLAASGRAVFTCRASVPHLPPPATDPETARSSDYRKFRALLQNLSFLSFHSPHSAHMGKYLAGNFRRFFYTHGIAPRTLGDAAACLWRGGVLGHPSGHVSTRWRREKPAPQQP